MTENVITIVLILAVSLIFGYGVILEDYLKNQDDPAYIIERILKLPPESQMVIVDGVRDSWRLDAERNEK